MKKIGIIQPGRLGDIIILLPAAKYLHDKGYQIFWPIFENYIPQFFDYIEYVNFLPVKADIYSCVAESYRILNTIEQITIFDVAATFPDSQSTEDYVKSGDGYIIKFDEFKYNLLNVPIDEKWKLTIKRNLNQEDKLFRQYITSKSYGVFCLDYSGGRINVQLDSDDIPMIEINTKHNLFDWIKILENAKVIALVESSIANLVEQLNLPNKKILFKKPDSRLPCIKNTWKII